MSASLLEYKFKIAQTGTFMHVLDTRSQKGWVLIKESDGMWCIHQPFATVRNSAEDMSMIASLENVIWCFS